MKGRQLAQVRPTDTSNTDAVSPTGDEVLHITEILVCNTTSSAAPYRIFHDEDGATYDQTTALFYDVSLPATSSDIIELDEWMNDNAGNMVVRSGTGSALTYTFTGEILGQG